MAAKAVLDLVSNDKRFLASMNRVQRAVIAIEAKMGRVAASAKRMLLVGAVAIGGFLKLASDQIAAEAKLEAVLKSTGNAAELSASQMKAHASEIQNLTGVGDEAVIAMQAILATFKEIKGVQFTDATMAIVDMATVLGTDLRSAAIQVGKALNDPLRGVSMLSRSGVTFTDVQLKMIKTLAKAGDIMGAQKIVLAELNSQFGGAAETVGKTFTGSVKKATSALGDMGEAVGGVFIPFVTRMTEAITRNKDRVIEWVERNKTAILTITGMTAALGFFTIGIHLATKALIASTIAVKALGVAMIFFTNHPIIAALTLIAAGVVALGIAFKDVISPIDATKDSVHALTSEILDQTRAAEDWEETLRRISEVEIAKQQEKEATKLRQLKELRDKGRGGPLVSDEEAIRRDVTQPFDPFAMPPIPQRPLAGPPERFRPEWLRVQLNLVQRLNPLLSRLSGTWKRIQEASKKVNESLDEEAMRVKDMLKTDQQRVAEQVKRINLLQAAGRLTAEEALKARARLTEQRGVGVAIEDATSMFRRITVAAAGLRPGAQNTLAQQTAQATKTTAENTGKTTNKLGLMKTMMELLNAKLDEIMADGLKTQARYS